MSPFKNFKGLVAVSKNLTSSLLLGCSEEQKSWFIVFYQELAKLGTTGSASELPSGPVMPDLVPRTAPEDRWSADRYVEVKRSHKARNFACPKLILVSFC